MNYVRNMQKLEITKELKNSLGTPINDVVSEFMKKLPEDIKFLMALGCKFELHCKQRGESFQIIIRSHDLLSLLKDENGNIVDVIKKPDETNRI